MRRGIVGLIVLIVSLSSATAASPKPLDYLTMIRQCIIPPAAPFETFLTVIGREEPFFRASYWNALARESGSDAEFYDTQLITRHVLRQMLDIVAEVREKYKCDARKDGRVFERKTD